MCQKAMARASDIFTHVSYGSADLLNMLKKSYLSMSQSLLNFNDMIGLSLCSAIANPRYFLLLIFNVPIDYI